MMYKGYEVRWSRYNPMSVEIGVGENKGTLPEVLKQLYTSKTVAISHIDNYLNSRKPKGKQDGEYISESGSK